MSCYKSMKYIFAIIIIICISHLPPINAQTDSTYLTSYITLVKDIRLGGNDSNPHKITNVNGMAYFLAKEPSSYGIWKSDGTEEGTQFVADLDLSDISLNYSEFTSFNNQLFFKAADTQVGYGSELWATDGTEEGTRLVKDIYEGGSSSSPSFLTVKDSVLLFLASSEDLVAGGTETELWRTDGTTEGTYMVKDIWPGPYHGHGGPGINGYTSSAVVNDIYYFSALGVGEYQGDNYIGGLELWRSNGTEMGTYLVTDLTPFREAVNGVHWSYTHNLTNFNNKLVFSSYATEKGNEIFISDGTAIGTKLLKDICSGVSCCTSNNNSFPSDFIVVDSLLYFMACDGINGRELWVTDGTEGGTKLVVNLSPGEESTTLTQFTAYNGMLYFVYDNGDEYNGNELWRTDGTVEGTVLVKDIALGVDVFDRANNSNPQFLTVCRGLLYFSAWTPEYGTELWQTNGTENGTIMLQDLHPLAGWGGNPQGLTNINETLFFSANSQNYDVNHQYTGHELWKVVYDPPTSVKKDIIKMDYKLSQNYPNPFNPTTTITYSIPTPEIVTLKIFDVLGREVKTLVNERKQAGNYKIEFDANGFSSGIYFYSLRSGNFVETKKLILLQ